MTECSDDVIRRSWADLRRRKLDCKLTEGTNYNGKHEQCPRYRKHNGLAMTKPAFCKGLRLSDS